MQEILLIGSVVFSVTGLVALLVASPLNGSDPVVALPKWVPVPLLVAAAVTSAVAAFL